MKKTVSILLIISLLLPLIPIQAFASSDGGRLPDYHKRDYIEDDGSQYRKVYDDNGTEVELDRTINVKTDSEEENSLPETYDSRDFDRVTYAKNQGSFGTCWAFAFCAAAESSLISQKYGSLKTNLSESHLAYFRGENYDYDGKLNNPALLDKYAKSDNDNFLRIGGNDFQSMAAAARWSGFVDEVDFKYDTHLMEPNRHSILNVFNHKYDLKSAKIYDNDQRDEIKQAIMRSGAVTTSFYFDSNNLLINNDYSSLFTYQKKYNYANHEVIVIGWDDNYAREDHFHPNICDRHIKPPGNGAWLIKNSWGLKNGDYIWVSYYDTSLTFFTELNVKPSGDYDNNYQYDGTFCTGGMGFTNTVYGANIFKAKGNESLKGCGFYAFDATDYEVTAYVYKNLADLNDPTSGTLTASTTIGISQEGYYTLDFDEETPLTEGDDFSVVIQYSSSSDSARMPYEDMTDTTYTYTAEKGQSFYSSDGESWTDITDEENKGNIPIKAFTSDVFPGDIQSLRIRQKPLQQYYCAEYDNLCFESLDTTDMIAELVFKDGTTCVIPNEKLQFSRLPVKFKELGEPEIKVSYRGFSTTFKLYIEYRTCTGYEMITPPTKRTYYTGDKLNIAGVDIAIYFNDGRKYDLSVLLDRIKRYDLIYSDGTIKSYTTSPVLTEAGEYTVRLMFKTDNKGYGTVEYDINVIPLEIERIELADPVKTEYVIGSKLSNPKVKIMYHSGAEETITEGYTLTGYNPTQTGTQTVTVTYEGFSVSYDIVFTGPEVYSIRVGSYKEKYKIGDTFKSSDYSLLLNTNDGITYDAYHDLSNATGFVKNRPGLQTITVSYYGFETTYKTEVETNAFDQKVRFNNDELYITGIEKGKTPRDYITDTAYSFQYNELGTGSPVSLYYYFTLVEEYTLVIFGDVNCDGVYDGRDAVMLNCIVNGMLTKEQVGDAVWKAADCNHDGEINEADVELLNSAGAFNSEISQSDIV